MSSTGITTFLKHQAEQYKKHQKMVKSTQATLSHQLQMQSSGTIPKKHRPQPPSVTNGQTKFTENFMQVYGKLFFKSLQEAIIQNSITMELEKTRCLDILRQTERELCLATELPELLSKCYTDFLQHLNLTDHQMSPELQLKLHPPPSPSGAPTPKPHHQPKRKLTFHQNTKQPPKQKETTHKDTAVKRKHALPHPIAKKQAKLDHFLELGQKPTPDPT